MLNLKNLADLLLSINNTTPIYLCGHTNPDQDSVGSCLSLSRALRLLDKKSFVLLKENDKNILSWQNDYQNIVSQVTHSEFVFIALDLNELNRLGEFEKDFLKEKLTINIDHHSGNKTNANFVYSDEKSSSTCEIIYNLLMKIDKNLITYRTSENLYAGIMTDTNCFTRRITKKTFYITQHLINSKIDYQYINKSTLWKRTKEELYSAGKLANEIKQTKHFNYVIVNHNDYPYSTLSLNDLTKKVAEDLRKIENLDVFVMFIIRKDGLITAKVMTNVSNNADVIANLMGGGGHKKESGFTTSENLESIVNKIDDFLSNKN